MVHDVLSTPRHEHGPYGGTRTIRHAAKHFGITSRPAAPHYGHVKEFALQRGPSLPVNKNEQAVSVV
jgi:hypothetical protein